MWIRPSRLRWGTVPPEENSCSVGGSVRQVPCRVPRRFGTASGTSPRWRPHGQNPNPTLPITPPSGPHEHPPTDLTACREESLSIPESAPTAYEQCLRVGGNMRSAPATLGPAIATGQSPATQATSSLHPQRLPLACQALTLGLALRHDKAPVPSSPAVVRESQRLGPPLAQLCMI